MGAVLQGVNGAISAYGSYQQGMAQSNYYRYLAANSRTEQGLVQQQADQEKTLIADQGAYQLKTLGRRVTEMEGAQTAAAGANVGGGSGTTADIAMDTFNKAKLDEMAVKYNADIQSWKTDNAAKLKIWKLKNEEAGYGSAANESERAGRLGAMTSLLGSASQIAGTASQGSSLGGA